MPNQILNEKLIQAVETITEIKFPKIVIVEICNFCNLKCIMCPYQNLKRKKGIMNFELYKKIVDEIREKNDEIRENNKCSESNKDTELWPAIMGEPLLLGNEIYKYIEYAKDKEICVILNTNGTLLDSDIYYKLTEKKLDKIIIGLDAYSKNIYSKIRGENYDKIKKNILDILEVHKTLKNIGIKSPEIILQFIVMNENAHEEESFKKFWLSKGAKLKIRKKLGWGNAIKSENLDMPPSSPERVPCPWLMRTMSIHWCGRVAQCDGDYEGIYSPGDIRRQTLEDIWLGELKNRRDSHWEGIFSFPPCDCCKDWQVGLSEWHIPGNLKDKENYGNEKEPISENSENEFQDTTITNASKSDLKDIIYLWKYLKDDTTPDKIELMLNDQRGRRDRILICKIYEDIIGFIAYNIRNEIGHIAGIVIIPKFRRNGYGTLLLKSAERELKISGYNKITLEVRKDNIMAIKYYKDKGYILINKIKDYYKDTDALIFDKTL